MKVMELHGPFRGGSVIYNGVFTDCPDNKREIFVIFSESFWDRAGRWLTKRTVKPEPELPWKHESGRTQGY